MHEEINVISTEETFVGKLTDDETELYLLDNNALLKLHTVGNKYVDRFVDIARLNNNLHNMHLDFNERVERLIEDNMNESLVDNRTVTADEEDWLNEWFSVSMTLGNASAVLKLMYMDDCDALYVFLATLKMNAFNWMLEDCQAYDLLKLTY